MYRLLPSPPPAGLNAIRDPPPPPPPNAGAAAGAGFETTLDVTLTGAATVCVCDRAGPLPPPILNGGTNDGRLCTLGVGMSA